MKKAGGKIPPAFFLLIVYCISHTSLALPIFILNHFQIIIVQLVGLFAVHKVYSSERDLKKVELIFNNGSRFSPGIIAIHH